VRELLRGSERIGEIARGVPGMSPPMLGVRIKALGRAGLVERLPGDSVGSRYRLTAAGRELRPIVEQLGRWGQRWLPRPGPGALDPSLLLFDMTQQIDRGRLPMRPVAVEVEFADGPPPRRWWLVLSRAGAVARDTDPGITVSLRVTCTLAALAGVWLGHTPWLEAVRDRDIQFTGGRNVVRAVIGWIGVSRYVTPRGYRSDQPGRARRDETCRVGGSPHG
jgi:hypothetical protein